jgi:Holliday junction resolvase RusA-like endonuclease
MKYTFTVPGAPRSKLRHRSRIAGGHIATYSPKKNKVAADAIQKAYLCAYTCNPPIPFGVKECSAVSLHVKAFFVPPRSWSKKKRTHAAAGGIPHMTKPDPDNILKLVSDALEGLAYRNDKQIVQASCTKQYSESEHTDVEIIYHGGAAC